jgi:hypothetical protein
VLQCLHSEMLGGERPLADQQLERRDRQRIAVTRVAGRRSERLLGRQVGGRSALPDLRHEDVIGLRATQAPANPAFRHLWWRNLPCFAPTPELSPRQAGTACPSPILVAVTTGLRGASSRRWTRCVSTGTFTRVAMRAPAQTGLSDPSWANAGV